MGMCSVFHHKPQWEQEAAGQVATLGSSRATWRRVLVDGKQPLHMLNQELDLSVVMSGKPPELGGNCLHY